MFGRFINLDTTFNYTFNQLINLDESIVDSFYLDSINRSDIINNWVPDFYNLYHQLNSTNQWIDSLLNALICQDTIFNICLDITKIYNENKITVLEKTRSTEFVNLASYYTEEIGFPIHLLRAPLSTIDSSRYNFDDHCVALENRGFNNTQRLEEINIYPNPSNGHFSLVHNSSQTYNRLLILDLNGKTICASKVNIESLREFQIEMRNVNDGLFFIKLYNEKGDYQIKKLIVQKSSFFTDFEYLQH